jgi:alpha-tubulin suppressor-like RCC1 family protein
MWATPGVRVVLLFALVGCRDDAASPTEPTTTGLQADLAAVVALSFRQVSAGGEHTCGVTAEYQAYCWGSSRGGQLGIGTDRGPDDCAAPDFERSCSTRPMAVVGGLRFRAVSAGFWHTCGVTTDDVAYCWGGNGNGEVGNGSDDNQLIPVRVQGGIRFRQLEAGLDHTCGVSRENLAYCWGRNSAGQLGDGTLLNRSMPVPVSGGRLFRVVTAGGSHSCGVTLRDQAFCWGSNQYGQIGDSTQVAKRLRPSRVAGTRQFRQVAAGDLHTCAVTTGNRAFCWGHGLTGQTGDGTTKLRFWPRRVAGDLDFSRVTANGAHTCGESTSDRVYCWGANSRGELGAGTITGPETCDFNRDCSTRPVAVTGGLFFTQVTAGHGHNCGRTSTGVAYCWGDPHQGQLGNGSWFGLGVPRPTAVVGPL